jgi:hypothetical protein
MHKKWCIFRDADARGPGWLSHSFNIGRALEGVEAKLQEFLVTTLLIG